MAVDTAQADRSSPFPQGSLEANKAGRVTDLQMQVLRANSRGVRKGELSGAAFSVAMGILIFFAVRPGTSALIKVVLPLGLLALAAFLLLRALTGTDRLTRDLRDPQVESLEGPISKHVQHNDTYATSGTNSRDSRSYYLDVAGQRFEVGPRAYAAAPEAGFVRLFYLPISKHVINLEHLPDRTLPTGTTPRTIAHDLKQAILSHDRAQLDTFRAEVAGTENQLQASLSPDTTPPPAETLDPRPLAEAIVGTWSNGPVTAVIASGGTFTVTILGANQRSGTWSVGGDGKLMVNLSGRGGTTEAWVAGDRLTISLGDQAVTLNRVSG